MDRLIAVDIKELLLFHLHHVFLNRWRTLPLSHSFPLTCSAASTTLLSASGGLLCFSLPNSFFLCNVLNNSAKSIDFLTDTFESASLIPTTTSPPSPVHGYKLLLLCSSQSANSVLVYNSGTEKWERFDGYDPILKRNSHQEPVFFNGLLHFTTREPFSIVGFDLDTGRWRKSTAELPQSLVFVRLVSADGGKKETLYLVGGIGRDGISKRVKVWEMMSTATGVLFDVDGDQAVHRRWICSMGLIRVRRRTEGFSWRFGWD